MKTLIELYDERPIENVLGTEMFHPQETIYVCPPDVAENRALHKALEAYFAHRGCKVHLTFAAVSLLNAGSVEKVLKEILQSHEDCCVDISGGTDAALFAAGSVCRDIPVVTYSRKKNAFFEIRNAPFALNLPCRVRLDAASCFLMAGGQLLPGREDSKALIDQEASIDALFSVYAHYRRVWNRQISMIQKISRADDDTLMARGSPCVKADQHMVTADRGMLEALADCGLILDFQWNDEGFSFRFRDPMARFWLRDMGSVLELQVFRACRATGLFDDVVLSAVVNWEGGKKQDAVTNEIDVMAVRGVQPLLISCKTCEIRTEALNELAILRDRFGGKGSRAMIVTSASATRARKVMRNRARELGIEIVEWEDCDLIHLKKRLKTTESMDLTR